MGTADIQKRAREWAEVLVRELADNLHNTWAEKLALGLAGELEEVLQEDLIEVLPPSAAAEMAEDLAGRMARRLRHELQEDLPEDLRGRLRDDLEALVRQQLDRGQRTEQVWKAAAVREEELAEQWARWLACQLTSQIFKQIEAQVPRGPAPVFIGSGNRSAGKKRAQRRPVPSA